MEDTNPHAPHGVADFEANCFHAHAQPGCSGSDVGHGMLLDTACPATTNDVNNSAHHHLGSLRLQKRLLGTTRALAHHNSPDLAPYLARTSETLVAHDATSSTYIISAHQSPAHHNSSDLAPYPVCTSETLGAVHSVAPHVQHGVCVFEIGGIVTLVFQLKLECSVVANLAVTRIPLPWMHSCYLLSWCPPSA